MANLKSTIIIEGQNKAQSSINEALQGLKALADQVNAVSASMGQQSTAAQTSSTAISTSMQQAAAAMKDFGAAARSSAKQFSSEFKAAAKETTSSIDGIKNAIGGFIAFSSLKAAAKEFIHLSDEITNANAKIKLATLSTNDFAAAQKSLFAIAQKNSSGFAETASIFARMKLATSSLKYETSDIIGVVDTLQKTFLLSGASSQEAKYGLMEFSHAMSEGKLQGRQLNALMMENPVLIKAIADGLGTTTGKLREYSKESALSTETLLLALTSQKDKIDELSKNVPITFGRAMTQMKNALMLFVGDINESNGATSKLSSGIVTLSKHISDIAFAVSAAVTVVATAFFTRFVPAIGAAIVSLLGLIAELGFAGVAMEGFHLTMLALGGPLGVIGVILGTVAAGFVFLGKSAADAATKAADAIRSIGDQATKMNSSVNAIKNAKTELEVRAAGAQALKEIATTQKTVDDGKATVAALKAERETAKNYDSSKVDGLDVRIKAAEQNIAMSEQQMADARKAYIDKTGYAIGKNVAPTEKENIAGAQKSLATDELKADNKKFESKEEKLVDAIKKLDDQYRRIKGISDLKDESFKNGADYKKDYKDRKEKIDKDKVGRGPKNTGSSQQFQTSKAESKAEADKVVNEEKELNLRLKEQFEDGLITLKDYQDKRVESRKRTLEAELKYKREELDFAGKALAQAKKGGNVNEIESAKGRSFSIQADIEKLEGELTSGKAKFSREFQKENDAEAKGLADIRTKLGDLNGLETDENIILGVKQKLINDLRAVERASGAEKIQAQEDYNKLLEKEIAARQFKLRVADPKSIADGVASEKTQAVSQRVADGSITQVQADKELTEIRREQAAVYERLIPLAEKYKNANEKIPAEIEVMKTAVRGLNQVVDSSAVAINKTLTDSISSALDGLIGRTMTFKQAFLSVFSNVAKEINKQVGGALTDTFMKKAFGADGSKTGGVGGFFSSTLFGGGKDDKSLLGTAALPMYVTFADSVLGMLGLGKSPAGALGALGKDGAKNPLDSATSDFASTMKDTFTKMTDSVSGFFSGIGNTLTSLFSSTGGVSGAGEGGGFMSAVSSIGSMLGFAEGGHVQGPGNGTSDSIMARLSNGEFVMNARAVGAVGLDFLNGINSLGGGRPSIAGQMAYATGGMVQSGGSGGHSAPPAIHMTVNTSDAKSFQQSRGQIESQMRLMVDRSGRNS